MSTIVVVKKNGYAAIASDSLTKCGRSKDLAAYVKNHDKILKAQNNYLAVVGPTSAKVILADYFSQRKTLKFDSVGNIFQTWITLHAALKENYFLKEDEGEDDSSFESSQMDCLIANRFGIFGVSEHRAVQEFSRFYAYGGGSVFALGAMYAIYEDKERTALDIATTAIEAAAEFDDGTSLPIISHQIKLK